MNSQCAQDSPIRDTSVRMMMARNPGTLFTTRSLNMNSEGGVNFNAELVFRRQGGGGQASSPHELWRSRERGHCTVSPRPTLPVSSLWSAPAVRRNCSGAAETAFVGALLLGCGDRVRGCAEAGGARPPVQSFLSRLLQQCLPVSISSPTSMSRAWAVQCLLACTEQFLSNLNSTRLTALKSFSKPTSCLLAHVEKDTWFGFGLVPARDRGVRKETFAVDTGSMQCHPRSVPDARQKGEKELAFHVDVCNALLEFLIFSLFPSAESILKSDG